MDAVTFPNEVYGTVRLNDAEIEIIELMLEHPWGALTCPPHVHAWFEMNYVYEGTMQTGFGGPMLTVGPGEFFLIPPGMEHSHIYVPEAPHKGICLRWTVNGSGGIYDLLSGLRHWKPGCYTDRYGIGERLLQLHRPAEPPQSSVAVQLSIVQLLLSLASVREPQGRAAEPHAATNSAFLRKIEIYLNDERSERTNIGELAASLHMSYHHMARKYKKLTGQTIVERLTEIRLERAVDMLTRSDASISYIAALSGYASIYYFSRVFKKVYGISPTAYRQAQGLKTSF